MWHEVGFLARAFCVFRDLGVSIDLVSTSETNVTVSLDSGAMPLDETILPRLEARLTEFCGVRVIRPCAAVSLVGSRIRGMLHRMGPALEAFQEHRVHLVSQAASDLNLTFVVDEDQAVGLVRRLHALLIPNVDEPGRSTLGPSWSELESGTTGP
jgi:diaminopimelate decarboxylase/aspartate kinase